MKSPSTLAVQLAKQWCRTELRVARLLDPSVWPVTLNIGKPTGQQIQYHTAEVQTHLQRWQAVTESKHLGKVEYEAVNYRSVAEPIRIPVRWMIRSPSEWIAAANNKTVTAEFRQLSDSISQVNSLYRERLIRERSLWRGKSVGEVIQLCQLADQLEAGVANGRPLRLLSGFGVDTKLIERNVSVLQKLLDERFDGSVSEQGLITFLDAAEDKNHWLLIKPLSDGLLPFQRLRLTTEELAQTPLPAHRILLIENEQCEHLLPDLVADQSEQPDTIAILGAGLDLNWLASPTFNDKQLLYWGDLDTWGLLMLARARQVRPDIRAVMMDQTTFERYSGESAVIEPVHAQEQPPEGLTPAETALYQFLMQQEKGRLEQEYLPKNTVRDWLVLG